MAGLMSLRKSFIFFFLSAFIGLNLRAKVCLLSSSAWICVFQLICGNLRDNLFSISRLFSSGLFCRYRFARLSLVFLVCLWHVALSFGLVLSLSLVRRMLCLCCL